MTEKSLKDVAHILVGCTSGIAAVRSGFYRPPIYERTKFGMPQCMDSIVFKALYNSLEPSRELKNANEVYDKISVEKN